MSQLATIEHTDIAPARSAAVVAADAASLLTVISKAAADPATDVEKLERLMALYERITAKTAEQAYAQAFAVMQPELPIVAERGAILNKQGAVQSTYALWEDINEAIKPVLAKHGFSISFRTNVENGKIAVTAVLRHSAGHSDTTTIELGADVSGNKNAVQAIASSVSYGKRYTAGALLNLTSRGEDDDGGSAAPDAPAISEEQFEALRDMLDQTGSDIQKFCRYFGINGLANLPPTRFNDAMELLRKKAGGH